MIRVWWLTIIIVNLKYEWVYNSDLVFKATKDYLVVQRGKTMFCEGVQQGLLPAFTYLFHWGRKMLKYENYIQ